MIHRKIQFERDREERINLMIGHSEKAVVLLYVQEVLFYYNIVYSLYENGQDFLEILSGH